MSIEIVMAFLSNILLLLGLAVVYSIFPFNDKKHDMFKKLVLGLLVSLIGVTIMSTPFELSEGIVFDARAVVLSISGMFFGLIPTLLGMLTMSLYRILIGGTGAMTGVLWVVFAGLIGLAWRHLRLKNPKFKDIKITWIEIYLFSVFVQVVMITLLLTLPGGVRNDVLRQVSFPLISIYPIGSLLIAEFMLLQRARYFQNAKTQESENQYRSLFQKNNTPMFLLDAQTGKVEDINEMALSVYGYSREEFLNMTVKDINTLDDDEVQEKIDLARTNEKSHFLFKHILKNGDIIDVDLHSGPIELDDKDYILTTVYDITEKVEKERLFRDVDEKLRATLLSVSDGIAVTDELGRISLINDSSIAILGEKKNVSRKKIYNVFRIYSSNSELSFKDIFMNCLERNTSYKSDGTFSLISNDDDSERFVEFSISPVNYEEGVNHGAILVIRDVTVEKANQDEIRFISIHDFLTNLYNRFFFEEQVKRLDTARQLPLSLIIGDVNGLKILNDTFGHLEGDKLLIEISKILKKATRSEDIVARWGGDEFVILLPQTSNDAAKIVYQRIIDLCDKSMYKPIRPSISLGIATKTDTKEDIFTTLNVAEERMYERKTKEGKKMRVELISALEKTLIEKNGNDPSFLNKQLKLAEKFAKILELSKEQTENMYLLTRLHDIGKVMISSEILQKPDSLTPFERNKIKVHPEVGSRIAKSLPELQHLSESILYTHEHYDGTGYPKNLKGKEIPLLSQIVAIIDYYEILIDGRIYQESVSHDSALKTIQSMAGKRFNPDLVEKFLTIF